MNRLQHKTLTTLDVSSMTYTPSPTTMNQLTTTRERPSRRAFETTNTHSRLGASAPVEAIISTNLLLRLATLSLP